MELFGWDTVFACSNSRVNEQLKANMSQLIVSFDYEESGIKITGEFDAWSIVQGGSDTLLHFETPIKSGSITAMGQTYDLAGVTPVLELQLDFIENTSVKGEDNLKFNCKVVGTHPGDTTPGAVTVVNTDTSNKLTGIAKDMLHDNLPKCLIANKSKLAYIFASIGNPSAENWLTPKRFAYIYTQPVSGSEGSLAVLGVVTDRDISGLQKNVDSSLLNGQYNYYFAMSSNLFLEHVVMPGLPAAYGHGTNSGSFKMSGNSIVNTGNIGCDSHKWGLITYYPSLNSLNISVQSDSLKTSAGGRFDITGLANAYVTFNIGSVNKCVFHPDQKTISFDADPNPTKDYSKHIPWYDWVGAAIGGVVILGIVSGVMYAICGAVASSVSDSINSGGNLSIAKIASFNVNWSGLTNFDVKNAGLSGAFYMRGDSALSTSENTPPELAEAAQ